MRQSGPIAPRPRAALCGLVAAPLWQPPRPADQGTPRGAASTACAPSSVRTHPSSSSGPGDLKKRLRAELLRWHPDKFAARVSPALRAPSEREAALAGARAVAQQLTAFMAAPG
jgi:hypothetical protein